MYLIYYTWTSINANEAVENMLEASGCMDKQNIFEAKKNDVLLISIVYPSKDTIVKKYFCTSVNKYKVLLLKWNTINIF